MKRTLLQSSFGLVLFLAATTAAQTTIACPPDTALRSNVSEDSTLDYCESVVTGMRNGPVVLRYASGLVLYQGQYRDGRPDGRWVGRHFNGRRAGEADFVGGALTRVVAWYDDGELAFRAVPPFKSFSIPKRQTAYDPTAFVELVFLRNGASR